MFSQGYTIREVADRLGISRQRVHQLLVARNVPTVRPDGRTVLVPRSELGQLKLRVRGRPRRRYSRNAIRQQLRQAVYAGKIRRPESCERCKAEGPVDGHHTDYSRPLYVTWLCRLCHAQEHAKK